jgi:hypothetical protein
MAWDLNGSDQYARFSMNATLEGAAGGPMTMLGLVHLDSTADGAVIHELSSGGSPRNFMEIFSTWNYGTSAGARTGPAGTTGAWYIVIISKNTGAVAPEYTLMTLSGGTFGSPSSGTLTGGGVSLGDGTSPGAGGIIQVGRWGTSGSEYVDGRVAAAAIWNAYKNQAAREALVTWALVLASAGIQWAARFDTLSTINDATGNGGNETGRFGTTPFTLAADPTSDFFGGASLSGAAALSAVSTLTAAGVTTITTAAAALSAGATLTAAATRTQFGAAALAAGATLAAAAVSVALPTAGLSAVPTLAAAGTRVQLPGGALAAAAVLAAAAGGTQSGAAALTSRPALTATATGPAPFYRTAVLAPGAVAPAALTAGAGARATLTPGGAPTATLIASTL